MNKTSAVCLLASSLFGLSATAPAKEIVRGLIPVPAEMRVIKETGGSAISATTKICFQDEAAKTVAQQMARELAMVLGGEPGVTTDSVKGDILLKTDAALLEKLGSEGYQLEVKAQGQGVAITAATADGLYWGWQTLRQLLPPEVYGKAKATVPLVAPACWIEDKPQYAWRGMHMDSCRHFFPKEEVKKVLDMMATQKLNTFHWHLTEDQAWRIEIKKYPRLTEIGAWRDGTGFGLDPKSTTCYRKEDGKYGGFYTQEDIKEVVAYAAARHINVVPEIELPGHAMAALFAYPELSCMGDPAKFKYPKIPMVGGIFDDVYCAGNEQTYAFLEDVLSETIELFPSKVIHIGGDECPKTKWNNCPKCKAKMAAEGLKNGEELQSYVIRRIEKFVNGKGRSIIGWDEILEGGLAPNAKVMSWRGTEGGLKAAGEGHDVVMSPGSHCYFDHYQAKQGEPKAIGGFLPMQTVYQFDPMPATLAADKRQHILGGQANLWAEYFPNEMHLEYMIAPRISALAEVLWSPKQVRNWQGFQKRLPDQLRRFDAQGFNYRKPEGGPAQELPFPVKGN